MIAVTSRSRNAIETPRTTFVLPKDAVSCVASRRTRAVGDVALALGVTAGDGARDRSVATAAEPGTRCETGGKADDKDDSD